MVRLKRIHSDVNVYSQTLSPIELDELDERLVSMLTPAVERLGYFGEFFGYFGQTPDVLIEFMELTGSCKKLLPDDINELLALVVCSRLGGDYERIQHERLCEKLGFDRDWVGVLTGVRSASDVEFTAAQSACRELAEKVVATGGRDVAQQLEKVVDLLGATKALAVLWQISRFSMICMLTNSLSMQLPVPSIFDESLESR